MSTFLTPYFILNRMGNCKSEILQTVASDLSITRKSNDTVVIPPLSLVECKVQPTTRANIEYYM